VNATAIEQHIKTTLDNQGFMAWHFECGKFILQPPNSLSQNNPNDVKKHHERDWLFVARPSLSKPNYRRCLDIRTAVLQNLKVPFSDFIAKRRTTRVSLARHVFFYLARHHTPLSFNQIGLRSGGHDHTTIMHGIRRVDGLINSGNREIIKAINEIRQDLKIDIYLK
jgi:hypothetical protein